MDKWKSDLECPICTLVPRRMKIFSCLNGHDICEFCFDRLGREVCPQGDCSYGIPGSKVRCRKLEKLIENADFVLNCSFVRVGCVVEGMRKDLDHHEITCEYRAVPCPQLTCAHKLPLKMLENHLEEHHRFRHVRKREEEGWNVDRLGFQLTALQELQNKLGGADFLRAYQFDDGSGRVYTNFHMKDRQFFIWLTLNCSPSEAKDCLGTIRVSNPNSKFYLEIRCPVASIDTAPSGVLESGHYLAVSGPSLEKLWVPGPQEVRLVTVSFKVENI